jgi:murein DD-endopeptidase MepM/ murein hydrolase activator NlpD
MSIPRGIYTFESVAFPGKMLNLYYNGSVANGQNVVLYTRDGSEEQKWRYYGGRLITMRNENFALDRYHTSNASNQNNNNADVWAIADTDLVDQVVRVRMISDNIAVIILNDNEMVLKAVSSANGTNSGKTPQSSGNVYWSEPTENFDSTQKWYITRVDVEDETDEPEQTNNPYHALNWGYVFDNLGENFGYYGYDPNDVLAPYEHHHYGIDIICNIEKEDKQLLAPANGTVYAVGGDLSHRQTPDTPNGVIDNNYPGSTMGFFVVLKMDQKDPVSGKDMYVRYLHLKENSHLRYGDRVLKGDVIGLVGNTGTSDTAHLHLDINTKSSGQWTSTGFTANNTINPVNFFPNVNFPSHYYQIGMY